MVLGELPVGLHLRARREARRLALGGALLLAACSGTAPGAGPSPAGTPGLAVRVVNPRVAVSGALYVGAGPDTFHADIYRVELPSGRVRLVADLPPQGVSLLDASAAGVVFSAALSQGLGRDHVYRLNPDGTYTLLSREAGGDPIISPAGDLAWVARTKVSTGVSTGEGSGDATELHVRRVGEVSDRVLVRLPGIVWPVGWLDRGRLALSHLPKGAHEHEILIVSPGGRIERRFPTGVLDADPTVGCSLDGDFVLGHTGIVIRADGSRRQLPQGWMSWEFSPDGVTLVMQHTLEESPRWPFSPRRMEVGFAPVADPERVTVWAEFRMGALMDYAWAPA
jgi:hypothetical protein